jgi:protein MpaA
VPVRPAAPAPHVEPEDYVEVTEIGRSVEGRPLTLHVFGRGPCHLLVLGGIHGNEPGSAVVCEELVKLLQADPGVRRCAAVAVIPAANPDGLARGLRGNTNLVDLNRNFPASNWKKTRKGWSYGGPSPSSEPETRALLAALERLRPRAIISVHAMARSCNNYDGPAEELARLLSRHNGYPVRPSMGYPTPGSMGSWAGIDRQIPIVTLELPAKPRAGEDWNENRDALLAAIRDPLPLRTGAAAANSNAEADASITAPGK